MRRKHHHLEPGSPTRKLARTGICRSDLDPNKLANSYPFERICTHKKHHLCCNHYANPNLEHGLPRRALGRIKYTWSSAWVKESMDNKPPQVCSLATLLDNTLAFTPISAPGYRLEAISTSGEEVLVSHENLLFTAALDSTQAVLLSDHYLPSIGHSAAWLAGTGDVAAIVQSSSVKTLVVFDQAGDGEKNIDWRKRTSCHHLPHLR
jgi:hypothetical protein